MTDKIHINSLYTDLDKSLEQLRSDASRVQSSRRIVEKALSDGNAHYGINTGFGILANKRIGSNQLKELQRNLLVSHAVGVGDPIPQAITRLMLKLKIHALGLGYSGVSSATFSQLLEFAKHDILAIVPSRGSLGASGDLAPLAHLFLPLIGAGQVWSHETQKAIAAKNLLAQKKLSTIELQAKDGLALINGTQMMSAYGAYILHQSISLIKNADIIASLSLEALQGSITPFDPRIHQIRPHRGQIATANNMRKLLADSEILQSHRNCGKVQDPYCLRCIPQVHGACKDALNNARMVVETEINSVTDNPLVFENGDILSGGNFHGEPLALVLDFAAIALAELASIAERRTYLLLEGHDGLPKLLMRDTGVNSGFMIPQYTSAALVSENKVLCHPASVDSIPSSLGQEDHVSMGSISAVKLLQVFKNVQNVLGIELYTATQALDYRSPYKAGLGARTAQQSVREKVQHIEIDNQLHGDMHQCIKLVSSGALAQACENACGEFEI